MKNRLYIVLLCLLPLYAQAQTDSTHVSKPSAPVERHKDGTRIYSEDAIYQGMSVKLDLGNTLLQLGLSKGKIQSYQVAMNWRIKQRFYPTFEMGYTGAKAEVGESQFEGQGGFGRIGIDLNPMKKHPERPNCLLVGLRLGTAVQQYNLYGIPQAVGDYWPSTMPPTYDYTHIIRADAWGEVVAGCQVQVWEGLQMGWYVRLHFLFTRNDKKGGPLPYYIPGYGYRGDTAWGLNYYIGYKF